MNIALCLSGGIFLASGFAVVRTAIKKDKVDIVETAIFALSGLALLIGLIMLVITQ
ncbi:hypothetical protein P9X10_02550 [Bacillus cereus]|nr:hypothetical protein [Bacillus cereus]